MKIEGDNGYSHEIFWEAMDMIAVKRKVIFQKHFILCVLCRWWIWILTNANWKRWEKRQKFLDIIIHDLKQTYFWENQTYGMWKDMLPTQSSLLFIMKVVKLDTVWLAHQPIWLVYILQTGVPEHFLKKYSWASACNHVPLTQYTMIFYLITTSDRTHWTLKGQIDHSDQQNFHN